MCAKSLGLSSHIAAEIAAKGPLSFARYMELALYHPELGFYASGRAKIGSQGDFYTNVSVGALFGELMAGQFREIWQRLGCPRPLPILEQGANDGRFAADVLNTLLPDIPLLYTIVEPFPVLQSRQKETLRGFGDSVRWVDSLDKLESCEGIHFSNELVDAMPFHILQSRGKTWIELLVDWENDHFVFRAADPGTKPLLEKKALPTRPDGTLIELRPLVRPWLSQLSRVLTRGFVLLVDYGFPREELQAAHRTEGTFSCYQQHRRDARPLEQPGEKDICAHVDFSSLAANAENEGFQLEGFTDQHHFLVGAATKMLQQLESSGAAPGKEAQKTLRSLQTLLHPESMGTQFRYLGLSKGLAQGPGLSGFRYAGNPRVLCD